MRKRKGKKMTKVKCMNLMVKKLCAKEKGKKQLNAGDCREIIKVFTNLYVYDEDFYEAFFAYFDMVHKGKKK